MLSWFVIFGCSDVNMATDAGLPMIEVGTGEKTFQSVTDAGGVELVMGPQGGYHIWIAVRCQNLGPRVEIEYAILDAQSREMLSLKDLSSVADLAPQKGWDERAGLVGFLSSVDKKAYWGRRVVLWANVEEESGREASAEAETTILAK